MCEWSLHAYSTLYLVVRLGYWVGVAACTNTKGRGRRKGHAHLLETVMGNCFPCFGLEPDEYPQPSQQTREDLVSKLIVYI